MVMQCCVRDPGIETEEYAKDQKTVNGVQNIIKISNVFTLDINYDRNNILVKILVSGKTGDGISLHNFINMSSKILNI